MINSRTWETVSSIHCFRIEIAKKQSSNQSNIFIISDSTTIVDFCDKIVQSFEWNYRLLVKIHFQLHLRSLEVRIHPFIRNVPTDCTIFTSLKNDCMEKGKWVQKTFKIIYFCARVVVLLRNIVVRSKKVCLETFRWLVCDLYTVLKDRDRESSTRHRCKPKSIIRMSLFRNLIFLYFLKCRHPTNRQVTIL